MNPFIQLLIATFTATSAMTMFSYIVSASFKELYKEPLLLKYLLIRLKITVSDRLKEILAWLIHYLIGFIFVLGYYLLWLNGIISFNVVAGIYLGAICGVIGIIGWIIMLKLARFEKKANDKGYYIQLFLAHIIFGITAIFTFLLINGEKIM
ncbi:hypothetical protein [Flavobacterium piscis]|uniref:DUF2938 family protein n=1 Tax=Flavobacterium piscis TaxID=1114874 RepID=A0ABU1YA87_9FLAO|nr:hypothetical protein [Flavobacterium piscis]MDR7211063.1 hypothetical protein [Flavobacterium piscis]